MTSTKPGWFDSSMARLFAGEDLDAPTITQALSDLKTGQVDEAFAAAFLVALRFKGESADELTAAAALLRSEMVAIDSHGQAVLDTCGTGGDDSGTFNISTAAALVACAAGVKVVKHGNRAVSSQSGSADLLMGLGIPIENGLTWSQRCLDRHGFAFCFAPHVHPGMAAIAPLRRKLGVRSIFNLIGPLTNPARAEFQLLGVGKEKLLDPLAQAVCNLGVKKAVLVNSGNLDEVSLEGLTNVRIIQFGHVHISQWSPDDFGLDFTGVADVKANSASESTAIVKRVFAGDDGPAKRYVLANAAAALWVAGAVKNLRDGVAMADEAIRSGRVLDLVNRLAQEGSHAA